MYTRRNLAVGLVLAISMVGISYGAGGDLPGDGLSESTAYLIEDMADFEVFADPANAATYWAGGVYTKLACDPNLTGRPYTTAVIAPDGSSFEGVFDGDGHIVRNLTIDTDGAGNDSLGLFGEISGSGAAVRNLGVENTNITGGNFSIRLGSLCGENRGTITNCYSTGSVINGRSDIGGLCGFNNYGTITNCHATGPITGRSDSGGLCGHNFRGTIINCYATGSVTGRYSLGGLCGDNYEGIITNCYAVGSITGETDSGHLAGLCGFSDGTITNCYATGSVAGGRWSRFFGGLCGENEGGTITNCYAKGSVTVGEDAHDLGGLCGYNEGGTITNCYAIGSVDYGDGSYDFGGLCGVDSGTFTGCFWDIETGGPDNGIGTPKTTAEMQTRSTFTNAGWDFTGEDVNGTDDFWRMCVDDIDYPKLSWQFLAGDFTCPAGVNLIDFAVLAETWHLSSGQAGYNGLCDLVSDDTINPDDLAVFAENWLANYNGGNGSAGNPFQINTPAQLNEMGNHSENWDKHFVLTADIDMADYSYTTAVIAPDTNFDLNGHQGTPFTGTLDGAGFVISNLTIDAADTDYDNLGLFGRIGPGGEVINLGVENVNIICGDNSWYIGGLCGAIDEGAITNCNAIGSITGGDGSYGFGILCGVNSQGSISDCYSRGSVTAAEAIGGLCGYQFEGTISNCYAACSVTGGDSSEYLGGLCGYNSLSTITNCYSSSSVTGSGGGLCGDSSGVIINCYSTGLVTGDGSGLCKNSSGDITNCFWDVETSGMTDGVGNQDPDPAGVMGKTTAEMQTRSTFTDAGWDFVGESANGTEDIWDISEGANYPYFSW